jgi:hypothetical protein
VHQPYRAPQALCDFGRSQALSSQVAHSLGAFGGSRLVLGASQFACRMALLRRLAAFAVIAPGPLRDRARERAHVTRGERDWKVVVLPLDSFSDVLFEGQVVVAFAVEVDSPIDGDADVLEDAAVAPEDLVVRIDLGAGARMGSREEVDGRGELA